jgi:hypothetical protein
MLGIPMGTTCALLHADLSLHSYEADFLQGFLKNKNIKLTHTFNSNFRYLNDVLSLNNSRKNLLLSLTFTSQSTTEEDLKENYDKRDDSLFQ